MTRYDSIDDLPERYQRQIRAHDTHGKTVRQVTEVARRIAESTGALARDATSGATVELARRELTIELPLRSWSLNDERSSHWRERDERTRTVRQYAFWAITNTHAVVPLYSERVEIEATSYGIRTDPGNDLPTVKALVDALVDLGILEDDRGKFVSRLILNAPVPSREPAKIRLVVRPVEELDPPGLFD